MRTRFVRLAVLAAGTLALLAAACGGGGGGDGEKPQASACPSGLVEKATSPVGITFWFAEVAANQETLVRMVDEFNASQGKVKVTPVFQGSYDDSTTKYLAALRSGDLPDIAQVVDFETQRVIDSKSVVRAQDCIDAEEYDLSDHLPRVVAYWSIGDALWSYPFTAASITLYYNMKAFEKAGLDPARPPATLAEVREYSQRIVDAGAARQGIAIETHSWSIENWLAKADQAIVNNDNGRTGRATQTVFDSDAGRELFTWIDSMVHDGLAVNVGRNPSGADTLLAIGSGDAAMTLGSSAAMRSVYGILESGQYPDVKVGVAPMPGIRVGGNVLVGGASLFIVSKSPPVKQEAARIFARWLNEPAQQAEWHIGSGYIPVRRSAAESPAVQDFWAANPQFKVAYDELAQEDVTVATSGAVIGPFIEVRKAVVEGMEAMLLQGADPARALQDAASKADEAIRSYNQRIGE
ncbi:MAG: ABC transporter substrate-binding protein [Chloroflexi bacterium]|nr:ABC transporter substrate-binding protein [Chloroflexota bacterium]